MASALTRRLAIRTLQNLGLAKPVSDLYYRCFHGFGSATPELPAALEWVIKVAAQHRTLHDGDYCEFGVFKGYSFWKAQHEAKKHHLPCRFFGFDSFVGLPAIGGVDQTNHGEFRAGQYECSQRRVVDNLHAAGGVDWGRTFLIPGFYGESLTQELIARHRIRKVGVALIDCHLYSSTVEVLRFLQGLIGDKTVLIMDDWSCFDADDDRGQRRAMREFLRTQPRLTLEPLFSYGSYSQVFLVRESSATGGA
jgi:O-methyltransferase